MPEEVIDYCLERCEIVSSESLVNEFMGKIRAKTNAPQRWRRRLRLQLNVICEMVSIDDMDSSFVIRDPKDVHVIATAIEGKCDLIITGDSDLLELQQYKNIDIITPAKFLKLVSS